MFGVEPNSRAILSNPEDGESGTSFPSQPSSRWSTRWYIHLKVLSESRAYSSGKVATSRIYPLPPCTFLGCQCTDPCYTRFMLQAGPSTFGTRNLLPGPISRTPIAHTQGGDTRMSRDAIYIIHGRGPTPADANPSTRGLRYVWPRTVRDPDPAQRSPRPSTRCRGIKVDEVGTAIAKCSLVHPEH